MSEKRRVLIVDDHAAVRRGLHDLIKTSGCYEIVGQTWNGRLALEMAEANLPDIVTLEYSLPCLGGLEGAHRLAVLTQHQRHGPPAQPVDDQELALEGPHRPRL